METIKLNLGDKIKIKLYNSEGEQVSPQLASQYECLLPDGSMEILAPIRGGKVVTISQGVEMDIVYTDSQGLYKFKGEAVGYRVSGDVNLLRIMPKSSVEHLQRRLYFRLNCILDIKNRFFESMNDEDKGEYKNAITKDISGGGLCILTNEKPKNGWYFDGIIDVGSEVRFIGKVVRVNDVQNRGKYHFEAGIEFIDISDQEREKVISFIFDSQRKMLKKGWLTT